MKKSFLAIAICGAFAISACSDNSTLPADDVKPAVTDTVTTPELGRFGIDLSARNLDIKPGDDFFMHTNGTWYDNYVIPADKTSYGAFAVLAERSEDRVKAIIEDLAAKTDLSDEEKLISDYYNSYMDIEAINAKGIEPLRPMLKDIAAIDSVQKLTETFGKSWLINTQSPIAAGLGFNRKNPDEYQMSVGVGGLGLPDRSYYLEENERFADILSEYKNNIAIMLAFTSDMSDEDAQAAAGKIIALETDIAQAQWPREKRRNRDLTLNQIARTDLASEYPDFDWDTYFSAHGYTAENLNMTQPQPINDVIDIINNTPLDIWKLYLTYHLVSSNADMLSDDIYNANFAFYGKVLNGQQEPRPRWKRAVASMGDTQSLGFAIGKVFVERHFPQSSKQQMGELVANLRTALEERITNLDWMGEETKKNAQLKLDTFVPKIGYPDEWQSFEGLSMSSTDLVGNTIAMRQFFREQSIRDELKPTNRQDWFMTPQRVNAYYNSSFNEIVFPAAILQPPFFDPNADPAVNYGAIGAVIGHEIGHGFDDQGSKSDAMGVQRNWWTDEDRAAFEAKTEKLIAQYSAYEALDGQFVNGANSLGENIGDVGGLAMAYHAYRLSLEGKEAPIIDGLSGDQRFFLAWAQVWRVKFTEEALLNRLKGGTHAPGRFRALAPRNHDAWYEAFDVQPGDALYLAPEDRVRIW
ncbi:peptidase M13 protein [Glaciecola punicea ACAM 611]|uniref:Peptidase M13 protein n=1 Tax=Glaciecola punicea ACAM 611 TaxID=1121923 RepID=H5TB92_9ALTE|nr:M13 family metallopeptidase [Glaciecola punicea]GAB55569.1 peptidase M13 protein [Glaciecola punicea ACAM 611]